MVNQRSIGVGRCVCVCFPLFGPMLYSPGSLEQPMPDLSGGCQSRVNMVPFVGTWAAVAWT